MTQKKRSTEPTKAVAPAAAPAAPKRAKAGPLDLRARLLAAAVELVTEKGVDGVSLREAARRVGVTHPSVYRHFPDKAALLAAVAEEGFRSLRSAIIRECIPYPAPRERFHHLVLAYVEFARAHPTRFRIMFGPEAAQKWAHPSLRAAETATFALCLDSVIEGQHQKQIREGDPREIALAGWVMVHGIAALVVDGMVEWAGLSSTSVEHLATVLTRTLFQGIREEGKAS